MRLSRLARLAGLAALLAAAGGCAVADTGAFGRLQDEVVTLRKDVNGLKAAPAPAPAPLPPAPAARAGNDDVAALQQRIADVQVDVDKMKSELLAATSRADEGKLKLQKDISDLNTKTDEQGQAAAALKAKAATLDDVSRRLAALEEKVDKLAAGSRPAAPPPVSPPTNQSWNSPEEMYDYGLGLVKRGEFRRGREVLDAFAAKYPDHKLVPNVLYWKGESLYGEKDYDGSILAFQDVIDRFPASDKTPDAMYKQGLAFLSLSDPKNAKLVFDLIQSKYPKSPAAELARKKASELK